MEERKLVPALWDVLERHFYAYLIIMIAIVLPADAGLDSSPLMPLLLAATAVLVTFIFGYASLKATWLSWNEMYFIGDDYVRIERERGPGYVVTVPLRSIAEVRVRRLPFSKLRVGTITLVTDAGLKETLHNIRMAEVIAEHIRPTREGAVFRPSVG